MSPGKRAVRLSGIEVLVELLHRILVDPKKTPIAVVEVGERLGKGRAMETEVGGATIDRSTSRHEPHAGATTNDP
jgi:hypothetical protein